MNDLAPNTIPTLLVIAIFSHGLAIIGGFRLCQQWRRRADGTYQTPAPRADAGRTSKP